MNSDGLSYERPVIGQDFSYIETDDEWGPKIAKLHLTEASIQIVMAKLESLFTDAGDEASTS